MRATLVWGILAPVLMSCGPGLAPGYRALTLGARIGQQIEGDLGAECKARRLACEAQHAGKPDMISACELPCLRALRAWSKARVAYNAAAELTWGGLETARLAEKHDAGWLSLIMPGLCAIIRALDDLRPVLGAKVASWLSSLGTVQGVVCGGVP